MKIQKVKGIRSSDAGESAFFIQQGDGKAVRIKGLGNDFCAAGHLLTVIGEETNSGDLESIIAKNHTTDVTHRIEAPKAEPSFGTWISAVLPGLFATWMLFIPFLNWLVGLHFLGNLTKRASAVGATAKAYGALLAGAVVAGVISQIVAPKPGNAGVIFALILGPGLSGLFMFASVAFNTEKSKWTRYAAAKAHEDALQNGP